MVSTLKGPIPPHPYYDREGGSYTDVPVPRIKTEGAEFAERGNQGSVNMLLQLTGQRPNSAHRMQKQESKDYISENVRKMRHIQRETKKKQQTVPTQQPVKALWKSSKYEHVDSKVKVHMQDNDEYIERPSSGKEYLRAHSRSGWRAVPPSRPGSVEPDERPPSVPRAGSAKDVKLIRRDIDFVKANGIAAKHSNMRRSPSLTALDDVKKKKDVEISSHRYGQVPKYLERRRQEWYEEEERRIASIPDPDMPYGHRQLPEDERQDTLKRLEETQQDLLRQLHSLPVRTDTLKIRTKKEELEGKLAELEEAVKIFSRPKVFVRVDDC